MTRRKRNPNLRKLAKDRLLTYCTKEAFRLYRKTAESIIDLAVFLKTTKEALKAKGGTKLWNQWASDPKSCPVRYEEVSRLLPVADAAPHLKRHLHLVPPHVKSICTIAAIPETKRTELFEKGQITSEITDRAVNTLLHDAPHGAPKAKHKHLPHVALIATKLSTTFVVKITIESSLGPENLKRETGQLLSKLAVSKVLGIDVEAKAIPGAKDATHAAGS